MSTVTVQNGSVTVHLFQERFVTARFACDSWFQFTVEFSAILCD